MFYVREEFFSRLYRVSSGFQKSFLKVLLGFMKPFAKHIVLVCSESLLLLPFRSAELCLSRARNEFRSPQQLCASGFMGLQ